MNQMIIYQNESCDIKVDVRFEVKRLDTNATIRNFRTTQNLKKG